MLDRESKILIAILLLSIFLNILGVNWGLPDRWNVDEPVAAALKMAYNKQLIPVDDPYHPTFYHFFLIFFMVFLLIYFSALPDLVQFDRQ